MPTALTLWDVDSVVMWNDIDVGLGKEIVPVEMFGPTFPETAGVQEMLVHRHGGIVVPVAGFRRLSEYSPLVMVGSVLAREPDPDHRAFRGRVVWIEGEYCRECSILVMNRGFRKQFG